MTQPRGHKLITLKDCRIEMHGKEILPSLSWEMLSGEAWLITGQNGGGKSVFASALAGQLEVIPQDSGFYGNIFSGSVVTVSFETASSLIEEERYRDDSDFVEGGVDPGRSVRSFIAETYSEQEKRTFPLGALLENHDAVRLCGITKILDRGLKYLSTGEIRRTLLCRALVSKPSLLILDEPFEGLDTASREILSALLEKMIGSMLYVQNGQIPGTSLILLMDRFEGVPSSVNRVLELSDRTVSFSGDRHTYDAFSEASKKSRTSGKTERLDRVKAELSDAREQRARTEAASAQTEPTILVEMNNVTVEWSGKKILDNLSWRLNKGEHWLIRGPNGSGKTTLLELITGDNPQVFRNDISLFGSRRGSGETIWELKEKMGIVSYRLHLEYRILGALTLQEVILSGLHDSIGLYQQCGEVEYRLADTWLSLAGFEGRSKQLFRELSYGEQRAILIARAAVKCPPILILDEPCHGLDEEHRTIILCLLEEIAAGGTSTLLHVTHDPTEVLACEKHILELCPEENPMYKILIRQ